MKILVIRGERIASLHQRFEVDFTAEPLRSTGIFAITGRTGAGKSTLLDAMCLGLFGQTSRISGKSALKLPIGDGGEEDERIGDMDPRHLLSKGSRHGSAEVDFTGKDGLVYRARWWVAKPEKSAALQDAEMSVVRVADAAPQAKGVLPSRRKVVELLGFTFSEFQKAVLLPQGKFAEFLKADGKTRAELLEKVAGGAIYAAVGAKAAERHAEEKQKVELLEKEASTHIPLPDERREEVVRKRTDADAALEAARAAERTARGAVAWHEQEGRLRGEVQTAERGHAEATAAELAAGPRQVELEAVERAIGRREVLKQAADAELQRSGAARQLEQVRERVAQATAEAERARAAAAEAGVARDAVDAERDLQKPILDQARRFDDEVVRARRTAMEAATAATEAKRLADAARGAAQQEAEACERLQREQEEARSWLGGRNAEAAAVADWSRGRELAERHARAAAAAAEALTAMSRATTPEAVEGARAELAEAEAKQQEAEARADEARKASDEAATALAGAEGRRSEAAQALRKAQDAEGLEGHRARLVADEPCPLCGAKEHPYAGRAVVGDLVKAAEAVAKAAEAGLAEAKRTAEARRAEAVAADSELQQLRTQVKERAGAVKRLADELERAGRAAAEAALRGAEAELASAEAGLKPAFSGVPGWVEELRAGAKAFIARWDAAAKEHEAKAAELGRAREALGPAEQKRATAETLAGERGAAAEKAAHQAAEADGERNRLEKARAALLGGRPVADVEADLDGRKTAAEKKLEAATKRVVDGGKEVAAATGQLGAIEKAALEAAEAVRVAAGALDAALAELGVDRATFEARVRRGEGFVREERKSLQGLAAKAREALALLEERRRVLVGHEAARPAMAEAEAKAAVAAAKEALATADRARLEAASLLDADARARQALADLAPRLEAQRRSRDLAASLSGLIGANKGGAFRAFAQGLALDALLVHANRQLDDLAPRYQLARLPGTDMELQILDRDFGDGVRGVDTLSGGETFLVSLGLALGLSGLATKQVQVESLFVDEGFGTLDQETLDAAMSVLERLQATGRTVGIISHVPELHERIGVLVQVEKLGAGRSRVRAVRLEGGVP